MSEIREVLLKWFDVRSDLWVTDSYYRSKVVNNSVYTLQDFAVLEYVKNKYGSGTKICEPGCGYGQLSILLAQNGYDVTGVEGAQWRFDGAQFLQKHVPVVAGKLSFVHGFYPTACTCSYDLIVCQNMVNTGWSDWLVANQLSSAVLAPSIILDARTWGIHRSDPHEVVQQFIDNDYTVFHVGGTVYEFHLQS